MNDMKCPVCGAALTPEADCPACGWLQLTFPAGAPEQLVRQQERRLAAARAVSHAAAQVEPMRQQLKAAADDANQQRSRASAEKFRADSAERRIDEAMRRTAEEQENTAAMRRTVDELTDRLNAVDGERHQLRNEVNMLRADIKRREESAGSAAAELVRVQADLRTANDALARARSDAQAAAVASPLGVVIIRNMRTRREKAAVVGPGVTTYGSAPDSPTHRCITSKLLGYDFAPQQFAIDTASHSYWVLRNLTGTPMVTKAGPVPAEGVKADNALGVVVIADQIEIKIIKI